MKSWKNKNLALFQIVKKSTLKFKNNLMKIYFLVEKMILLNLILVLEVMLTRRGLFNIKMWNIRKECIFQNIFTLALINILKIMILMMKNKKSGVMNIMINMVAIIHISFLAINKLVKVKKLKILVSAQK